MPRIHMESLGIGEEESDEKVFTLYWRTGQRDVIRGGSIGQAFSAAGFGGGAIHALDCYDKGETNTRTWDKEKKEWIKNV